MNDNEKAATFIGWRPFVCAGNPPEWADEHANRAPDMSDPRNYMRALEAVDALEVIFQQYDGLQVMIRKTKYTKQGGKEDAYGFDEHTWGDAVISALAALYDAEHQ